MKMYKASLNLLLLLALILMGCEHTEPEDEEFTDFVSPASIQQTRGSNFAEGDLIFSAAGIQIQAVHRLTQAVSWTFSDEGTLTAIQYQSGSLYVGSSTGFFYRINTSDGSTVWSFNVGSAINAQEPSLGTESVFFYVGPTLYSLSLTDGSLLWSLTDSKIHPDSHILDTAVHGSLVFFGNEDGISAFQSSDGSGVWAFNVDGLQQLCLGTERLFVTRHAINRKNNAVTLYALNVGAGNIENEWTQNITIRSCSHEQDGQLYIGERSSRSTKGSLYALNSDSFEVQWRYEATNLWFSSRAISSGGLVYFGDFGLIALDAGQGKLSWKFETQQWIFTTPSLSESSLYFTTNDGTLYFLSPSTGDLQGQVVPTSL